MIEEHHCVKCGKMTKVNRIVPFPNGEERQSGCYVSWMDENLIPHAVGVVCEECFTFDKFGGAWDGSVMEATADTLKDLKHEFFFPEFKEFLEKYW